MTPDKFKWRYLLFVEQLHRNTTTLHRQVFLQGYARHKLLDKKVKLSLFQIQNPLDIIPHALDFNQTR